MISPPGSRKQADEEYSADEARQRFEAAIRGARAAGHKPMKPAPKKIAPPKGKAKKR